MKAYEITQTIRYIVKANSEDEALDVWNEHPNTGATEWYTDQIHLWSEEIDIEESK